MKHSSPLDHTESIIASANGVVDQGLLRLITADILAVKSTIGMPLHDSSYCALFTHTEYSH